MIFAFFLFNFHVIFSFKNVIVENNTFIDVCVNSKIMASWFYVNIIDSFLLMKAQNNRCFYFQIHFNVFLIIPMLSYITLISYVFYGFKAIENNREIITKSRHSKLKYIFSLIVKRAITFIIFSTPLTVIGIESIYLILLSNKHFRTLRCLFS
jgi:hypothetical protein